MGYAEIRTLRADEIECRVSMVNEKGLGLLLYKDAKANQKILDETFTPYGWKRSHQAINGNCIRPRLSGFLREPSKSW